MAFVVIVNDVEEKYICSEMFGYIAQKNLNIRIHRDITGDKWFGK
jgi:hypothetical protein